MISRIPRQLSFVTITDSYISRVPTPLSAHGVENTGQWDKWRRLDRMVPTIVPTGRPLSRTMLACDAISPRKGVHIVRPGAHRSPRRCVHITG